MIAAVHACVGAAIGKLLGDKRVAFPVGVVSHGVCDVIPHKDFDPTIEAPLLLAALVVLGARCGVNSPEMAGAIGAVSPDFENAASHLNLIPKAWMRYPTHIQNGRYHGRRVSSAWPQGALAAACLAYVFLARKK